MVREAARRTRRRDLPRLRVLAALSAWVYGACAEPDVTDRHANGFVVREAAEQTIPRDIFEQVGKITLEEDSSVINVSPRVTIDPEDGSLVIADPREKKVRIYDRHGRILTQFGSVGEGPGEFRFPVRARRMADRDIVVTDFTGLVLEYDSSGTTFLRGHRLPIKPLHMQEAMGDGRVLVSGIGLGHDDPRPHLHVWDPGSETVTRSFFATPGDSLKRLASRSYGWSAFALRADTVAAVSALTDTLFFFTTGGKELARTPLAFRGFRRMSSYDPSDTPERMQAWLDELHLLTDVFWLSDGSFLIQYQRPRGADNEWNLFRTNRDGDRVFDVANTPELLAVHDDLLYFLDPQSLTPDRWIIARFR